jgi:hypothetical protein
MFVASWAGRAVEEGTMAGIPLFPQEVWRPPVLTSETEKSSLFYPFLIDHSRRCLATRAMNMTMERRSPNVKGAINPSALAIMAKSYLMAAPKPLPLGMLPLATRADQSFQGTRRTRIGVSKKDSPTMRTQRTPIVLMTIRYAIFLV